jgi:hypothetical protein
VHPGREGGGWLASFTPLTGQLSVFVAQRERGD